MPSDYPRRTLELKLVLNSEDTVSPAEFYELFRCGEDFSRSIVEHEAFTLLEEIGVPADSRLATLQSMHQFGRRLPSPAEVQTVEKGSWLIVLTISSSALLFLLKAYLHPVVLQAWNESDVRARVLSFLQNQIFRSAKRKAEEKAIESARYGNLQVGRIEGQTDEAAQPSITITLERRTVLEVRLSDRELIEDFLRRFSR